MRCVVAVMWSRYVIGKGAEDDIKLSKYFLVFQREYVAEEGELQWKVADFGLQGHEDIAV